MSARSMFILDSIAAYASFIHGFLLLWYELKAAIAALWKPIQEKR